MVKDELQLIQRAGNGDLKAFREFVEQYQEDIFYFALDLTGNRHDAEDISQDVFIKVFGSLKNFRGDAKLTSWLYRITVNTYLNKKRKKSLSAMELQEDFSGENSSKNLFGESSFFGNPEVNAESGMIQKHIDDALNKLSPRQRSVFTLRHYKDLTLKEIAKTLEISEGTVKSLLFRAIKTLRKELSFYRSDFGLEGSQ